jgi:hypothetical protein
MGQQPILLMTLLLMIGGGDPVAEGIKMFPEKSVSSDRNAVCNDLVFLAARAHQYYSRPAASGGGGNSFVGLTADANGLAKLTTMPGGRNANGRYMIQTAGIGNHVVLEGVGIGYSVAGGNYVTMRIIVRDQGQPDSLYQVY